ncbi:MAG: glucosidase, partial [Deltaproteobacteria bacterium]|nr:glucosidase [Deltaproteobacteria bacterium]
MTHEPAEKRGGPCRAERERLAACREGQTDWRRFGPYLSERQWGTVREDYSGTGDAWTYFPHDHARSRAYRWGEDGIAGVCDEQQRLCLAIALWNERDPILKERLFGLTNTEGNHGEDVKEIYAYLDATPTASYLAMVYKYPQAAFPYELLVRANAARSRKEPEFELLDTGVFDDDRYFDVFVEYAKAGPLDLLMRVTAHNRGHDAAALHVLAQLWFRNTWSWRPGASRPLVARAAHGGVRARHDDLGVFHLQADGTPAWLFCENDTNVRRLYGMHDAAGPFKDAFHEHLVEKRRGVLSQGERGTKAAAHERLVVPGGGSVRLRFRLSQDPSSRPFDDFDAVMATRIAEADAFHANLGDGVESDEGRRIQRQAHAGLVWNRQYYHYDVREWLAGDPGQPAPPPQRRDGRNHEWEHLNNQEVISMPDKWEYPWYASWDLAFHCVAQARL